MIGKAVGRIEPDMEKPQIFENLHRRLEEYLPHYLHYHSANHTKYVIEKCEFLARQEGLSQYEIELIKVAALYHDAGFLVGRKDHETKSCNLASQELPEFNFTKKEIKLICGMINATRIPQKTHNNYENVVADADLFYLGTEDYNFYSNQLYKELKHFNPELDEYEWYQIQFDFLKTHRFHTKYGKKVLEPIKQINFKNLVASQVQNGTSNR